jgi:hypothetical protein
VLSTVLSTLYVIATTALVHYTETRRTAIVVEHECCYAGISLRGPSERKTVRTFIHLMYREEEYALPHRAGPIPPQDNKKVVSSLKTAFANVNYIQSPCRIPIPCNKKRNVANSHLRIPCTALTPYHHKLSYQQGRYNYTQQ